MADARVAVVGSLNCDVIVRVARLPTSGETILGEDGALAAGGKGLNQAVAAARSGAQTAMIGMVGVDALGMRLLDHAAACGVDCTYVSATAERLTGVATITVSAGGANMIAVAPGANGLLDRAALERAEAVIRQADVLLTQLETPFETVDAALAMARLSILNPAPADKAALPLCARADIVTPNEHELALLTGIAIEDEESLIAAMETLRAVGAGCVVATLGERGCATLSADGFSHIPAFAVDVVDTTGAGDTFNGALAAALAEGRPLDHAVIFASAAAAISVSRPSAEGAAPDRAEIASFLEAAAR